MTSSALVPLERSIPSLQSRLVQCLEGPIEMSDRRYKQTGYMDDDTPRERSNSRQPREHSEKPRGRGLGKPTKSVFRCSRCGQIEAGSKVSSESTCVSCGEDLHSCMNCSQFDTSAPNECREPIPEAIPKKSKRNECGYFSAKTTQEFEADAVSPDDARSAFDSLFDI